MSGELKPCPFCRAKVVAFHAFPSFDVGWTWDAEHTDECPMGRLDTVCYPSEQDVAAAWNTRTELSSLRGEGGWIVGDASGQQWRTWTEFGPVWTDERSKATRYARREDAEQVHAADEDAWKVVPFAAHPTPDSDVIRRLVGLLRECRPGAAATCAMLNSQAGPNMLPHATRNANDLLARIDAALASLPSAVKKP